MSNPHLANSVKTYNLPQWSDGFFDVNSAGELVIAQNTQISFNQIIAKCEAQGLKLPLLLRFPHILHDRVERLVCGFNKAIDAQDYQGHFTPVYPIKVNQQRRVVEEIINGQLQANQKIGLEAGSKAELLAVIALASQHKTPATIICNGYKDDEFIHLALMAEKLGHKVFIVIEKTSELDAILKQSALLEVAPRIGVRARLASIGKGNWQNTGGDKSKFGLTAQQILTIVATLKAENKLDYFQLLHFHLGSQIANIRDIQTGLKECGCFYTELYKLGVCIDTVDVGGGLGVDYEGTGSRSECSMNYTVDEYAYNVVRAFREASNSINSAMPNIITESGRAVTAHHAVLVSNIIGVEERQTAAIDSIDDQSNTIINDLWLCWQNLCKQSKPVIECYHEASYFAGEAKQAFSQGALSLQERATIEQLVNQIYQVIRQQLNRASRSQREIFDELNELLADKVFVNFSLFQSLPDVWGIDQIFPILPLSHLNQASERRAVIQDMTCDSDGRIDLYVDGQGIETTLPLPEYDADNPWKLGFFMLGAYQEILGDMHNLFGDTDSVDVYLQNGIELKHAKQGDTIAHVLAYVNLDAQLMQQDFNQSLERSDLAEQEKIRFQLSFSQAFDQTTYLK